MSLDVAGCDLGSDWLDAILGCTNLKRLDVSGCPYLFDGGVPGADFSFMRGLDSLGVSWCRLSSDWLSDILKCTSLVDLDVSYNDSIGTSHTNFRNFKNIKSLKRLKLDGCNLTAKSLSEICRCGGLEELSVGYNLGLWKDEVYFRGCRGSLRTLNVSCTEANEDVLRVLCGFPRQSSGCFRALLNLVGLFNGNGFDRS